MAERESDTVASINLGLRAFLPGAVYTRTDAYVTLCGVRCSVNSVKLVEGALRFVMR